MSAHPAAAATSVAIATMEIAVDPPVIRPAAAPIGVTASTSATRIASAGAPSCHDAESA